MRRVTAFLLSLALMMVALSAPALAQYEEHPNVGTWVTLGPEGEAGSPGLATISADGTVRDWQANGPGIGTWEPTGERTFRTTIWYPALDPEAGFLGTTIVRIEGEVAPDGQTATGEYTLGFPDGPEGVFPPAGEYGPVEFFSTKMVNEPMGETVGTWPPGPPPAE